MSRQSEKEFAFLPRSEEGKSKKSLDIEEKSHALVDPVLNDADVAAVVVGHCFSYVVAVASEDTSVNVGGAVHIKFRYVMVDCALTALAKSGATITLRIVATGCDRC
jgi:hypothetical protein